MDVPVVLMWFIFFCKKKTAYELRISAWSSDVCSSDLFELEEAMARRGKSLAALDGTRPSPGDITIVRQQEPLGLGHAVWCARRLVGDEPFAVLLPDDLMVGEPGCLKQMVEAYHDLGGNLICKIGRASCRERVCQ